MPRSLRQLQLQQRDRATPLPDEFIASIGDRDGNVYAGGNDIYVRDLLSGQTIVVKNLVVPSVPGRLVLVKRQGGDLYVTGIWRIYGQNDTLPQVGPHSHDYADGNALFVEAIQIRPLLVLPVSDFTVQIFGGVIQKTDGTAALVSNQQLDLSSYQPALGGVYIVIEADNDGALNVVEGVTYTNPADANVSTIPAWSGTALCAIKLYDAQTSIQRDPNGINDFIDLRAFGRRSYIGIEHDYLANISGGGDYLGYLEAYHLSLEEWEGLVKGIYADDLHIHDADFVTFTPTGNLDSVNVGNALRELEAEKASIDHIHASSQHLPVSVVVNTGTLDSGDIDSLQTPYDDDILVVDEVTGVPGFDIEILFQSVDAFDQIHARIRYDGGGGHSISMQVYNVNTTNWDTLSTFSDQEQFEWLFPQVADDADYIDTDCATNGEVLIRFYHSSAGNPSHVFNIDHVSLIQSAGGGGSPWDGDIADIDVTSSVDIGEALADDDQFIVYNTSGTAWVRSAISRLWTYISGKLSGANAVPVAGIDIDGATDIGADLTDADLIIVDDGAGGTNRKSALSRIKTYIQALTDTLYPPKNGWNSYTAVIPTRTADDDPTYTIQFASVDLTSFLEEGQPIKWTQNSIVRYGWISSIIFSTNTTITVLTRPDSAGTSADNDVLDTASYAISDFAYGLKGTIPLGFPFREDYWTITATDTSAKTKTSPTSGTWYGETNAMDGGASLIDLTFPIGKWRDVGYNASGRISVSGAATYGRLDITLSTGGDSVSDADFTVANTLLTGAALVFVNPFKPYPKFLSIVTKTTYYLLAKATSNGTIDSIIIDGASSTTRASAVCAYL